jgi:hypothetical protein
MTAKVVEKIVKGEKTEMEKKKEKEKNEEIINGKKREMMEREKGK